MGTKTHPGQYDCYAKAQADEPMFVLLARDPLAALLVTLWCAIRAGDLDTADLVLDDAIEVARAAPATDRAKIVEAGRCAVAMEAYRKRLPYCRVCLCTEDFACEIDGHLGCTWANTEKTICTNPACMAADLRDQARPQKEAAP